MEWSWHIWLFILAAWLRGGGVSHHAGRPRCAAGWLSLHLCPHRRLMVKSRELRLSIDFYCRISGGRGGEGKRDSNAGDGQSEPLYRHVFLYSVCCCCSSRPHPHAGLPAALVNMEERNVWPCASYCSSGWQYWECGGVAYVSQYFLATPLDAD